MKSSLRKLFSLIFGKTRLKIYKKPVLKNYMPWVSFIIPARNEEKSIKNCIDAILADNYPKTEIIVIDDKSTDKTREIVKKYARLNKNIKLFINKKRLGPSPNRNKGYKLAKGEIVIMFDAHSIISSKNFIKTYLAYFSDKKVGGVAGGREWSPKYFQDKVLYYAGGLRPWREMGYQFLDNPNAAYRKRVLDEMNGIDTDLVWGSDLSSTFKVLELGYKIPVAPGAKISIDHGVTPNRRIDLIRKPFLYGTMIIYILYRHFKWLYRRRVDLTIILGGLINLISIIIFLFNPRLFIIPILTIFLFRLHSIAFAIYSKAPIKYILTIPLVLTISEISYAIGFLYGILRKITGLKSFSYRH